MGSIQYVLSDKTGTLTKNKMELKGLCIADKVYGGEFSEKNGKISFIDAKFCKNKSPKKILANSNKFKNFPLLESNYEIFDADLTDLMINDERIDRLPIPKVMSGNLKITYLDEIVEESEEEKEMEGSEINSTGRKSGKTKIFNFKNTKSTSQENVRFYPKSANLTPKMNLISNNLTPRSKKIT